VLIYLKLQMGIPQFSLSIYASPAKHLSE